MQVKAALWQNTVKGQKYTGLFAELGLYAACILMSLLVFIFRNVSTLMPGRESYNLFRLAADISLTDALSFGGRFAAYPMGMPFLMHYMPKQLVLFLPPLIALLAFALFSLILKNLEVKQRRLALLIFLLSPAFIFLANTFNTASFAILLALFGFWLILKKSIAKWIALPAFMLIPLFDFTTGILSMLLLAFYAIFNKTEGNKTEAKAKTKAVSYSAAILTLLSAAAYYGYAIYNSGFAMLSFDYAATGLNARIISLVSDFGSMHGIGIFALILAVFGVLSKWDDKYKNRFVFFSIALLLAANLFFPKTALLLNLFIAVFAAYGFYYISDAKWESRLFQRFVLLIFACGILFSALSFTQVLVDSQPNAGIIAGIEKLQELPELVVFSDYTRGFWISFAGKANVMDENLWLAPDVNERWQDSNTLMHTRDLSQAMDIINKYGITYVWVDDEMKNTIWADDEDGLLFLLKYSSGFNKIYTKEGVGIWEVSRED